MLLTTLEARRISFPYREWVLQHRFITFFVLTLAIQQVCVFYYMLGGKGAWILMKLEMLGPMAAASFLIWLQYGMPRVQEALKKLLHWRVHPVWYFHALFWMPFAAFLAVAVRNLITGEPWYAIDTYWRVIPDTGFFNFLAVLVLSISEEFAWFGYAFAVLYGRFSAIKAAVLTGLAWGLTYVPLWWLQHWVAPDQPLWTVLLGYISWGIVCGWIYNCTRSALLLALMQIASNYSYSVFLTLPHLTGESLSLKLTTIALLTIAILLAAFHGFQHMSGGRATWRGEWDEEHPGPRPV
ncbi:MAG: CPBP family intramembrane glutamic endopeptidase [Pseudomonadales bacterium]